MRAYEIVAGSTGLEGLREVSRAVPQPGPGQVLVRMRAAALNHRDLAIVMGQYFNGPVDRPTVPLSDGAGEVVEVGPGVAGFAAGDRVVASFIQPVSGQSLGSPLDGALAEYAVFDAAGLVPMPANLNFEEAATLPCAGVTAWNALMEGKRLVPGATVLTLGTGGVSVFALQLARAAGARVAITSSSPEKLARAEALGAAICLDYRAEPDWAGALLAVTGGRGADHVVELGGAGTLPQSYRCVAQAGEIALIGVLSPPDGDLNPAMLMIKGAVLRGIFVGDVPMLQRLCRAVESNDVHPVIDQVFDFTDTLAAYRCLAAAGHFGKLVIAV